MPIVPVSTPDAHLTLGGPKTGKTTALVKHALDLRFAGNTAADIVIVVASPDAIEPMQKRLKDESYFIEEVRVTTARELALGFLSLPEAMQFTGRRNHMLTRYEQSFLMEDMKSNGLRPKRIKELCGFFYRSWADLADLEEGWLLTKEEEEVHGQLKQLLGWYRSVLEPEVSNLAYRFLMDNKRAYEAMRIPHLLIDDYQCMSRASQFLLNALAKDSIWIAGNPNACAQVYESNPYAKGMDEFLQANPEAQQDVLTETSLPQPLADTINGLGTIARLTLDQDEVTPIPDIVSSNDEGSFEVLECADPEEECAVAAKWVQDAIAEGIQPGEIAVVVPNNVWERNIGQALGALKIASERSSLATNIGGDIRDWEACRPAQVMCLLSLATDPSDEPSLRAWCGFGDELTNRQLFKELFEFCDANHTTLAAALYDLAHAEDGTNIGPVPDVYFKSEAKKVIASYKRIQENIAQLKNLTGFKLLLTLVHLVYEDEQARIPQDLARLINPIRPHDAPMAMSATVNHKIVYPTLSFLNSVKLVPASRAKGIDCKAMLVMGMVNGFTPAGITFDLTKYSPERAERALSNDAKTYVAALGQATSKIAVTWFSTMRGADAEAHGIKVERFFIKDGVRQARTSRSKLLDCLD